MRYLIVLLAFIGIALGQTDTSYSHFNRSMSPKTAFWTLLNRSIMNQLILLPYAYFYGTGVSGVAISQGESLSSANLKWILISTGGFSLSWIATKEMSDEFSKLGFNDKQDTSRRFYHSYYIGANTANIIDFTAESKTKINGSPAWKASTPEVKMAASLPSVGYRLGLNDKWLNWEIETALTSHHTIKQNVYYDAVGVPIGSVELPNQFLMLHSMSMGCHIYVWLPEVIITPYVGLGFRALLNSSQSQYPGPANLNAQSGSLALNRSSIGIGYFGSVGFHYNLSDKKFIFAEFRPGRHYFKYESGTGQYLEVDEYKLQYFEIQLGLGTYFF